MNNDNPPVELDKIAGFSRKYKFNIRSTDTGQDDTLTLHCLAAMIQEAASCDAITLGFGYDNLDEKNIVWILIRTSIRVIEKPKWRDELEIHTWTNGASGILALRDFIVAGKDGKIYAKATTSWILADRTTKRPVRLDLLNDRRMLNHNYSAIGMESPKIKLNSYDLSDTPIMSAFAGYSEIDRNGHVNNTRYIAACLDTLDAFGKDPSHITGFDINYVSEVLKGETIDMYCDHLPADDSCLITGKHKDTGKVSFAAMFYFKL